MRRTFPRKAGPLVLCFSGTGAATAKGQSTIRTVGPVINAAYSDCYLTLLRQLSYAKLAAARVASNSSRSGQPARSQASIDSREYIFTPLSRDGAGSLPAASRRSRAETLM